MNHDDALLGATLGHFRIDAKLGEGGMGVVYRATDERLRREVALKVLPQSLASDPARRSRFLREARAAAAVTHNNIATVHEVGHAAGHVFIAMELVPGETLRKRMAPGLVHAEAVRIATEVAKGLARAHEKGIVHRDLKPENVMITPDGDVKILDFGLAKLVDIDPVVPTADTQDVAASHATVEGRPIGTPAYMSPEQVDGRPDIDARSDIFSFGTMLYEMVSGALPFTGRTTVAVMYAVLHVEPEPLAHRCADAPPVAVRVAERCLRKSRDERFASGREVLAALDSHGHVPATDPPPVNAAPASKEVSGPGAASALGATLTPSASPRETRSSDRSMGARRAASLAGGAAAIAAVVAWAALRDRLPSVVSTSSPVPSASTSPAHQRTRFRDLPPSKTDVPEAAVRFRRAMRLVGDGDNTASLIELDSALEADPSLASAHLQYLINATAYCPTRQRVARPHFAAAQRAKDSLGERDRALLDALAPAVLDPPGLTAVATRVRALANQLPEDSEVWDTLGTAENKLFHFALSAEAYAHAAQIEGDSLPHGAYGWVQDVDEAEGDRLLEACLREHPAAEWCWGQKVANLEKGGRCTEMEAAARTLAVVQPASASGPFYLASALAGQDATAEAIALALRDATARLPEARRENAERQARTQVALWQGDFTSGLRDAEASAGGDPTVGTVLRIEALWEMGDRKAAADLALAYIKRAPALPRIERPEQDPLPHILARAHAGGALGDAAFDAARNEWAARWRERLDPAGWTAAAPTVWGQAFAFAASPADAAKSMAKLADFVSLPPLGDRKFFTRDGDVGMLLLAGGRIDDALPRLKAGADRCDFDMTRVQFTLGWGQALEAKGDVVGACERYRAVVRKWGNAKPRSVTADTARARIKALACSIRE